MDELHKMTSWMHQMMSQQQQVVETTPGHSQNLFTASETVNHTEKNVNLTPRAQQVTQCTSLDSLLGRYASEVAKWNCCKKQQSNLHTQGFSEYPNWLFGCPAQETEPNSAQKVWYAGIQ